MLKTVVSILLACCLSQAQAQGGCIRDLSEIFNREVETEDFSIKRTYILCPNTRFEPGVLNTENGQIEGGQFPLVLLENAHVKCGEDGSSDNNCVIDGTGTYAMFLTPYTLFELLDASNIIVEGITVDFWVRAGQIPIIAAAPFGDITFLDCRFTNNQADPLFFIDEILFTDPGIGPSGRSAGGIGGISGGKEFQDARKEPGFKTNWNYDTGPADDGARKKKNRRLGRDFFANGGGDSGTVNIFDNPNANLTVSEDGRTRELQVAAFRIVFQGCLFDFNSPVRNAMTQAGLSLIRFRGRNDPNQQTNPFEEYVGLMDARFIHCTFRNNILAFTGDRAVSRHNHTRAHHFLRAA